jgi:hypothetical protein
MRRSLYLGLASCLLLSMACAVDAKDWEGMSETGDGDGDAGDGDGDAGDGDGDAGDGDGGDGDGDTGDGDSGDGDGGDGDGESGDGDGDPNNCAQQLDNCDDLLAAFEAETLAIRSCTSHDDCFDGQVLEGTSCGCTHDWIARADADTTCFYDLIEKGTALQCELSLESDCDCPPADGLECDAGICNWNYF